MNTTFLVLVALGAIGFFVWLFGLREDDERANRRRQLREERERAVRARGRR